MRRFSMNDKQYSGVHRSFAPRTSMLLLLNFYLIRIWNIWTFILQIMIKSSRAGNASWKSKTDSLATPVAESDHFFACEWMTIGCGDRKAQTLATKNRKGQMRHLQLEPSVAISDLLPFILCVCVRRLSWPIVSIQIEN